MVTLTPPEMAALDPEARAAHLKAEMLNTFGHDVKFDRHGNPIEQGRGAPGRETPQHFAALEKSEGKAAADAAKQKANRRTGVDRW
jgi:hypothetical protein